MFDNTVLNIDVENDKWRSPLHVAFTPPSATVSQWGVKLLAMNPNFRTHRQQSTTGATFSYRHPSHNSHHSSLWQ